MEIVENELLVDDRSGHMGTQLCEQVEADDPENQDEPDSCQERADIALLVSASVKFGSELVACLKVGECSLKPLS